MVFLDFYTKQTVDSDITEWMKEMVSPYTKILLGKKCGGKKNRWLIYWNIVEHTLTVVGSFYVRLAFSDKCNNLSDWKHNVQQF